MNSTCPTTTLNNGFELPRVGFGIAMIEKTQVAETVNTALEAGYRLFDTSALYGNEKEFGEAIRNCGIPREELIICSKLPSAKQHYEDALQTYKETCRALGLTYLDLYMIYWPAPALNTYCEAWKALEHLYKEGDARNIGVSNFQEPHLKRILEMCEYVPVVDELECNPYLSIAPLRQFCQDNNIQVEAWFPLGGPAKKLFGNTSSGPRILEDDLILKLALKYNRTPAQIILRWEVQSGIVPLPKSVHRERIFENIALFDFVLGKEDMALIDGLNLNLRNGHDPETTNDL